MHDDLPKIKYSREQLIAALQKEYEHLIHDDFDKQVDMSAEEHLDWLNTLNIELLIEEATVDDEFTLNEFMEYWG